MKTKILLSAEALLQKLNLIVPLNLAFQDYISEHLKSLEIDKGEYLLEPGDVCRNVYFLLEGAARSFFYNHKGKECTGWFMTKGDLMISVYSYFTQQPASETIEILEPATLQYLSWQHMQAAYAQFPEANALGRIVSEAYYIKSEQRAILLRDSTAEARYRSLLESHENIHRIATQNQIASYLGITPETLSRLRSSCVF